MPSQPRTFFIKTFGCQANKSDSERIAGDYLSRGYTEVLDWRSASEVVVNTCSVRQRAFLKYQGNVIAQGREASKEVLLENQKLLKTIEKEIFAKLDLPSKAAPPSIGIASED